MRIGKYREKFRDMLHCGEAVEVIFFMAYIPIIICFEVIFIEATIIGTIPFLIYPPYFRRLKLIPHKGIMITSNYKEIVIYNIDN